MSSVLKSAIPGVLVALVVIAAAMATNVTVARSQVPTEFPSSSETPTTTETPTATPTSTESEFPPGLPGDGTVTTDRLGGNDRFETSAEISQFQFPATSERVYLARADNFPDSLSGGTLTGGPILLVPSCGEIPQVIKAEISRLSPTEVIALGGEDAVCQQVLDDAATAARNGTASESPSPSPSPTVSPDPSPSPTGLPLPLPTASPTETETPPAPGR